MSIFITTDSTLILSINKGTHLRWGYLHVNLSTLCRSNPLVYREIIFAIIEGIKIDHIPEWIPLHYTLKWKQKESRREIVIVVAEHPHLCLG